MSDSLEKPWSDSPNAPQIPYAVYFPEKANFVGGFLGAIFYGIGIALFFRCADALLNRENHRTKAIKWGLVVHTAVMFMCLTASGWLYADSLMLSYIDKRQFPGVDGALQPGPLGYFMRANAINAVADLMFLLNQLLADGFLLYRCYTIYSMNCRFMVFPCLLYLAAIATGVTTTYSQDPDVSTIYAETLLRTTGASYAAISLALNVILTLMIITRLVLHIRNIRNTTGGSTEAGGLYKPIISMLVESCALYATTYLVYIVTMEIDLYPFFAFRPILSVTQFIAPLLIVLRVANRTAVTSDSFSSSNLGSIRFRDQEHSTSDDGTVPDGSGPVGLTEMSAEVLGEVGVVAENTIEEVPLEGFSQN